MSESTAVPLRHIPLRRIYPKASRRDMKLYGIKPLKLYGIKRVISGKETHRKQSWVKGRENHSLFAKLKEWTCLLLTSAFQIYLTKVYPRRLTPTTASQRWSRHGPYGKIRRYLKVEPRLKCSVTPRILRIKHSGTSGPHGTPTQTGETNSETQQDKARCEAKGDREFLQMELRAHIVGLMGDFHWRTWKNQKLKPGNDAFSEERDPQNQRWRSISLLSVP